MRAGLQITEKSGMEAPCRQLHSELSLLCSEPFLSTQGWVSLASVDAAVFGAPELCSLGFYGNWLVKPGLGGSCPVPPDFT